MCSRGSFLGRLCCCTVTKRVTTCDDHVTHGVIVCMYGSTRLVYSCTSTAYTAVALVYSYIIIAYYIMYIVD